MEIANRKRRKYLAALWLLTGVVSSAAAQSDPASSLNLHQWGAVTLFHGLPSDHVRAIAQDADGVLWFGTDAGLARYDGRRTQKVIDAGLPMGRVQTLQVAGDGALWVGTDSGAAMFVRDRFHPIAETAGESITAISAPARGRTLLTGARGRVFICVSSADGSVQVRSIGPEKSPLLRLDSGAPLMLTSLANVDGSLLIGTRGRGLLVMTGEEIKEVLSRPRPFFIQHIVLNAAGRPWFGAETSREDSGLYRSEDLLQPQKVGHGTGAVTSMAFDAGGDLWVGTAGQGVFRYRDSVEVAHFTFENTAGGLRSSLVYSVFVDREGVVWFGTDRGVCRYDPRSPRTELVSTHPESNFVRVLFQSKDGRWWGGTNRGLFFRESVLSPWLPVEELAVNSIHAIAEDSTGRLLIGTGDGFYVQTPGSGRFTRLETEAQTGGSVRDIAAFQNVHYLASFHNGLERFDDAGRTVVWPLESADDHEREALSLQTNGSDRLWIGTAEAGLFVFDGMEVKREEELDALKGSPIWDIERTRDGTLWLATGRGLYSYSSKKLSAVLSGSDARRLVVDEIEKTVWCATAGNGLFRIRTDGSAVTTLLDTEHGLPSNSVFTIFPERSDVTTRVMWLGTNRGTTRYEPGTIPPVLRAIRILAQRLFPLDQLSAGLIIEYPQNSLLLEVAASSSRTFPEQFQYSFSLIGEGDKVIKERISRDAQFLMDGLKPGHYRVKAQAFDKDLVSSALLAFDFNVEGAPFPWTSAALSALLGLAVVVLWYGYRQNRKLTETNAALAFTRRQLANETENERRRIARDLHDQTLSDLRQLLLLTDQLPAKGEIEPAAFREEIESISQEIRHICEDLSPSVLANVGTTAALEFALSDNVAHLPAGQKFEYEFVCGDDVEDRLDFDAAVQIQIYRIVQEAISNVCRHAAASRVRLSVEIGGGDFVVTLEDDGRGFDAANKPGKASRGLNNIRSRASLIDAEVQWNPRPGGGIVFTLRKRISVAGA